MKDIDALRKEIDEVNTGIVELLKRRMEISAQIAAFKQENGLPVNDPEREQAILDKVSAQAGEELAEYAREVFETLFRVSRSYQERCGEK